MCSRCAKYFRINDYDCDRLIVNTTACLCTPRPSSETYPVRSSVKGQYHLSQESGDLLALDEEFPTIIIFVRLGTSPRSDLVESGEVRST
jgi:hypothetical protein